MPTSGTLILINDVPGQRLSAVVDGPECYCCDSPTPGVTVDGLDFGKSGGLDYARRGGHGCNGNQGSFTLSISLDGKKAGSLGFNFDSDANIGPINNPDQFRLLFDGRQLSIGKAV